MLSLLHGVLHVARYLSLLTEEHAIMKTERGLLDEFERLENAERDAFHALSARVRSSHEREREYAGSFSPRPPSLVSHCQNEPSTGP